MNDLVRHPFIDISNAPDDATEDKLANVHAAVLSFDHYMLARELDTAKRDVRRASNARRGFRELIGGGRVRHIPPTD